MDATTSTKPNFENDPGTRGGGYESTESQERRILAYLKSGKTLTPLGAEAQFDCMRVSARIFNLRKKGHPIKTTMIKTYSGKRIARYSYEQEDS